MDIAPVLHKAPLKSLDEKMNDLNYLSLFKNELYIQTNFS
jgi:hypothetical protein